MVKELDSNPNEVGFIFSVLSNIISSKCKVFKQI